MGGYVQVMFFKPGCLIGYATEKLSNFGPECVLGFSVQPNIKGELLIIPLFFELDFSFSITFIEGEADTGIGRKLIRLLTFRLTAMRTTTPLPLLQILDQYRQALIITI